MAIRANNIFYWSHLNIIGGVETWLYEIAVKYGKDYDILIVYDTADKKQLERLRPLVRTIKRENHFFVCEKLFIGYSAEIVEQTEAKEIYPVLHADYKTEGLRPYMSSKVTGYIGVSKNTCKTFKEITGLDAEVCYNPISKRKPRKILHLISATRISQQKAPQNMIRFAEILDKSGIPYVWDIFTNGRLPNYYNDHIVYHAPTLDVIDYVAEADYLVQLSRSEGYSYSIIESLMVGTPLIITEMGCLEDMQVKDRENAFVLPYNFTEKDVPIKEIYKGLPKFSYTPRKDEWTKYLAKGESKYQEYINTPVLVKTVCLYFDIPLQREMKIGETQTVARARADYLVELGLVKEIEDEAVSV